MIARIALCALLFGALLGNAPCRASSKNIDDRAATLLSNSVTPFAVAGELALFADGKSGRSEAQQGAKALAATAFTTELLKLAVREKRPTGSSLDSFPSGHTSEAFAMATVLSEYHPKYAVPAYALATAIGWSRVEGQKHGWQDVVAGALLGHFVAKHFANRHIYAGADGIGLQYKY